MQLLLCLILVSLGAAVFVAGQLKARGAENPVDHIKPSDQPEPVEPKLKPSRETGRQIFAKIVRRMKGD